jgi:hypothetical protein
MPKFGRYRRTLSWVPTNPPPALPRYDFEDCSCSWLQYKEDLSFGQKLQIVIDGTDDLMEQRFQAEMMTAMDIPALMFDIDALIVRWNIQPTTTPTLQEMDPRWQLQSIVNFVKKWCDGSWSGDRDMMRCIFITARYCTELNAKATGTGLKTTYNASDELIASHVQFSGNLKCYHAVMMPIWPTKTFFKDGLTNEDFLDCINRRF